MPRGDLSEDLDVRTLRLPWPSRDVFPKAIRKMHSRQRARVTKAARNAAWWECKAQGLGPMSCASVRVTIAFTPPKRAGRPPDRDGMVGSMKAAQDGIAEAVGVDDGQWVTTYEFYPPAGAGHVELTMEPLS